MSAGKGRGRGNTHCHSAQGDIHLPTQRGHISKGRASARKEGPTTATPALGLAPLQRTLSQGLGGQGEGLGGGAVHGQEGWAGASQEQPL